MSTDPKIGPKMARLSQMRRDFVYALFRQSKHDATAACRDAGYKDTPALKVTAHTLWHDDEVQEAIHEEAQRQFKGMAPSALAVLAEVMANPQEGGATRVKAAQVIFDRSGLHSISERITTERPLEQNPDQLKRIAALAQLLGYSTERLLGGRLKVLDHQPQEAVYVEMSEEGLEGLI